MRPSRATAASGPHLRSYGCARSGPPRRRPGWATWTPNASPSYCPMLPADPLGVRAACAVVVEHARDVRLGPLEPLLEAVAGRAVPAWDGRRHYAGPPERLLRYLLVLD